MAICLGLVTFGRFAGGEREISCILIGLLYWLDSVRTVVVGKLENMRENGQTGG